MVVLRKTLPGGQVIDLSAPIRRQSRLDDHPLAPRASTPPVPLGGYRQLAVENLALRQQLAVYKERRPDPSCARRIASSSLKRFVKSTARGSFQLLLSLLLLDEERPTGVWPCSLCEVCHPSLRAVSGKW